jgi:hypothetical protein
MPFFQYDHIQEYSEVKQHTFDNIVLLCPNHHAAKTTNKLSSERIREAKNNPFNATREFTSAFKLESSRNVTIMLGSNRVSCSFSNGYGNHNAIWINGKSFLIIHSNNFRLSVSLCLTDVAGNALIVINNGEIIASTAVWDYAYEGNNIKVKAGPRGILLDLNLCDTTVEVLKGTFFDTNSNGFLVQDSALHTLINNKPAGKSIGCIASDNGFGGWGLLNSKDYPEIKKP